MTKSIKQSHRSKHQKLIILLSLTIALALGFYFYLRSQMQLAQVALIAQPTITTNSSNCTSNIEKISLSNSCGVGQFQTVNFTCKNGQTTNLNKCLTYSDSIQYADQVCGKNCTVAVSTPVPYPSAQSTQIPAPSPVVHATSIPAPNNASLNFYCKTRIFQLKSTDNPADEPIKFATIDREINPGTHNAIPGESYALLLEGGSTQSIQIATISAISNNLHGFDEPIKITSTSPYCQTEPHNKYFSCNGPSTYFNTNPQILNMGVVFTIEPSITSLHNTSITFHPNFINTNSVSWPSDQCGFMMLNSEQVTTTPTPALNPEKSPAPVGCYYEARFCISKLFGGSCPDALVCNTSTPSLTPQPSSTSTPTLTPKPVIINSPTPTPTPFTTTTTYTSPKPANNTDSLNSRTNFISCYRTCRADRGAFVSCIKSCLR